MNIETLQEKLTEVRERLLQAIEPLPDEAYDTPVMDTWTLKDLLAHISVWESELVTGLADVQRGKKPTRLMTAVGDSEKYNAKAYKANRDRDIGRIFDDLQGARIQLEVRLEDLTTRDLNEPKRYRWLKGKPLLGLIAMNSYEHEEAHLPSIEAFTKRWLADNEPAEPILGNGVIPLTMIESEVADDSNPSD